jgi:zinc-ribbon domain
VFCDSCGTQIQPGYNVCPKCGKVFSWPTAPLAQGRLARHLQVVGTLWIVVGALWLIPSVILLALGGVAHMAIPGANAMAHYLGPFVLMLIGWVLLIVGAGGICVGWGLIQHQPWARITAIVLAVLAIFHPPFGTALGIYTLWVLLADEGGLEYRRMARVS